MILFPRQQNRQDGAWIGDDFSRSPTSQANRRRARVFLGVLTVALVISLGFTWLRAAEYRASARLEITPATDSARSEPPPGASGASSSRPFLTEMQVLTSRPILELAATRLERAGQRFPALDPDPIAEMQSHLEAIVVPNTNVVELVAKGSRREVLAPLLNATIEAYREHLAESYSDSSTESLAQVNDEVKKLEEALSSKRRDAEAFRIRHNIVSPEREENQITAQTRGLGSSLSAADDRVARAEGKVRALTQSAAAGNTGVRSRDDPTVASLEQQASAIRDQLSDLGRDFTPNYLAVDPKAIALRSRLAQLERQIPVQREASQRIALAEAQEELASAQGAAARIRSQIATGQKELGQFAARFNEYKSKEDQVKAIDKDYQDASRRFTKLEATERARMPTLKLLEVAATPDRPWRPPYWRDTAISIGASLVLALLAMGLVELFNRPAPQPTMVLVQPQPGGLPYSPAPPALRWQTGSALPFEASPPTLLPQPAAFPRELNRDEVAALVSAADESSRLVALLLLSGVGPDEVLALRANDVDLARGLLNVGGVSARTIVVADELRALLAARLEAPPSEFLLGQQDRPATRDAMTAQILCAAHDASIERAIEVTPDCLRHTYLAFLVRQGIRFVELTRIVGHLPADTLGAYGALSPAGARVAGGSINVVFPAFPLRASG